MSVTGLGEIFDLGSKIIDKIFPDKNAADAAKIKLLEMQQSGDLAVLAALQKQDEGQAAINLAEAANPSLFVFGWRPFAGWGCAFLIAYAYLIGPWISWWVLLYHPGSVLPEIPLDEVWKLFFGLLGFGGLRSFEKIKGAARN